MPGITASGYFASTRKGIHGRFREDKLLEEARKRGFLPKNDAIKWLFFDIGSTLVDESKVYEDRMKKIAELSCATYEQVYECAMSFYKEKKKEI